MKMARLLVHCKAEASAMPKYSSHGLDGIMFGHRRIRQCSFNVILSVNNREIT
jgi:hypothetical protein